MGFFATISTWVNAIWQFLFLSSWTRWELETALFALATDFLMQLMVHWKPTKNLLRRLLEVEFQDPEPENPPAMPKVDFEPKSFTEWPPTEPDSSSLNGDGMGTHSDAQKSFTDWLDERFTHLWESRGMQSAISWLGLDDETSKKLGQDKKDPAKRSKFEKWFDKKLSVWLKNDRFRRFLFWLGLELD